MNKKVIEPEAYGKYLKEVMKRCRVDVFDLHTALGVSKVYLYDILSGRTAPPPAPLQVRIVEILGVDKHTAAELYDLAAYIRGEMPVDIVMAINESTVLSTKIRELMWEK